MPQAPVELQEKISEYGLHGYDLLVIQQTNFTIAEGVIFTSLLSNGKEHVILKFDVWYSGSRMTAKSFFDCDIAWMLMYSPLLQGIASDSPSRSVSA